MDFLAEYIQLAEANEWGKALPLIENIVSLNTNIGTSWFNYGVCLDALMRHSDASQAFLNAYHIDPDNYGAQYRAFRSLALANDENGLKDFLSKEISEVPEIAALLLDDPVFANLLATQSVQNIIIPTC